MEAVTALAEKLRCPVLTTFKGKGQISDRHPLAAGVLGRSGTPVASWLMNEADLLVVFGASFSNHTGITDYKPTIQIDYDAKTLIGRFHSVTVPVWGEIGATARTSAGAPRRGCGAGPNGRRGGALAPVARGKEAPWKRRGAGCAFGRGVRRPLPNRPGGCDRGCRCRQQHVLVRSLL